jgi:hypothetical protein
VSLAVPKIAGVAHYLATSLASPAHLSDKYVTHLSGLSTLGIGIHCFPGCIPLSQRISDWPNRPVWPGPLRAYHGYAQLNYQRLPSSVASGANRGAMCICVANLSKGWQGFDFFAVAGTGRCVSRVVLLATATRLAAARDPSFVVFASFCKCSQ